MTYAEATARLATMAPVTFESIAPRDLEVLALISPIAGKANDVLEAWDALEEIAARDAARAAGEPPSRTGSVGPSCIWRAVVAVNEMIRAAAPTATDAQIEAFARAAWTDYADACNALGRSAHGRGGTPIAPATAQRCRARIAASIASRAGR
jgi:hypothetical protein